MLPNAIARRAPSGSHPATTLPEDCRCGSRRTILSLCIEADRVARNDRKLVGQRVGDLFYDALQHAKPQREDDGIGALQRVAVAAGSGRSSPDRRSQRSCRLCVGARETQGLTA